jgi:hypothetical protein
MRVSLTLGLGVVTTLLIACPLLAVAAERKAFDDAVAVRHLKGLDDGAGANSALIPQGAVEIGYRARYNRWP